MIQETSLIAYEDLKRDKILSDRQESVYNILKNLECANNTILSLKLGWTINRITPRILELRKMGLVIKDSIRPCPITKKLTWFWRIK